MSRHDISLTIALCASLALHALLLNGAAIVYTRELGARIWLPGFAALIADAPQPAALPDDQSHDRFGDSAGAGEALASVGGELMQLAPEADQVQPFLSLDPAGFGKIGDKPTDSVLPIGRPGTPGGAAQTAMIQPQQPIVDPIGVQATERGDFALPPTAMPKRPAGAAAQAPANPSQPGGDGQTGAETSADPAPMGSMESDPFATVGSVVFRAGRTDVRLGRKAKLTRPHITLAGLAELQTSRIYGVVLRVKIDLRGNVTNAEIVRSSGTNDLDQPCKQEAYNWWIEPRTDKRGHPIDDDIQITIGFR